ncbi:11770_t:CDS:2, partial [Ambispora gerdemannii]
MSSMSTPATGNDPFTLIEKIKKYNTDELVGFLQAENLGLDEDDLKIIRSKKVTGRVFFKLTENKLEKWGMPSGSALTIADLINELKDNENEPPSKRMKVEDEDVKVQYHLFLITFLGITQYPTSVWTCPFVLDTMGFLRLYGPVHCGTPAADAWKEGLARRLGLTLTNFDHWTHINCLEYLAKVCEHLTSEDRNEIISQYKAQLRSISSSPWTLRRVRNKAIKLAECADDSFKRKNTVSFFERLDIQ